MEDLQSLFADLRRGDEDAVIAAMAPDPVVQDQRLGRLEGVGGVREWVGDSASWLRGLAVRPTELSTTSSERRVVYELSLDIQIADGRVDLPYVLVGDRGPSGFVELRTYHSTWPYTGGHALRAPPLQGRSPEPIPEIFLRYIDRVRRADVEAILSSFAPGGYVREPSGDRWRHEGADRDAFYAHLRDAPRAQFDLSTSTASGDHIAVEYGFAYGDTPMVGGICIMQIQGDRIAAVRITDDVGV